MVNGSSENTKNTELQLKDEYGDLIDAVANTAPPNLHTPALQPSMPSNVTEEQYEFLQTHRRLIGYPDAGFHHTLLYTCEMIKRYVYLTDESKRLDRFRDMCGTIFNFVGLDGQSTHDKHLKSELLPVVGNIDVGIRCHGTRPEYALGLSTAVIGAANPLDPCDLMRRFFDMTECGNYCTVTPTHVDFYLVTRYHDQLECRGGMTAQTDDLGAVLVMFTRFKQDLVTLVEDRDILRSSVYQVNSADILKSQHHLLPIAKTRAKSGRRS